MSDARIDFPLVGYPPGGDGYILPQILHDWTDEQSIAILKTCRHAMTSGATLLLIERVLEAINPSAEATLRGHRTQ